MLDIIRTMLIWVIPFLFVLTLIVTIHELGHFWAAKTFGVAVDRFSIGFGKAIAHWTDKSGVQWRIGWIPLGGYVRFAGDDNEASVPDGEGLDALRAAIVAKEGEAGLSRYFHFKPLWQRAIVVVAGPVANFILSITIFSALLLAIGEYYVPSRLLGVAPGSPAERAGFKPGDMIVSADGKPVTSYQTLREAVLLSSGTPVTFGVERAGRELSITATPERGKVLDAFGSEQNLGVIGFESLAQIAQVAPGGPADLAGFRAGDVVVAANGRSIESYAAFRNLVRQRPGQPTDFIVNRGGEIVSLTVTPRTKVEKTKKGDIRVGAIDLAGGDPDRLHRTYNPIQALAGGVDRTRDTLGATLHYIGRIFTGRESGDQLGGPIRIARFSNAIAEQVAEAPTPLGDKLLSIIVNLLNLAAALSVGIGFLNLLPVPVLDGGHLLFYAYEAVARRPLTATVQAAGYRVGLALVLGLMLFATWNDLQQLRVFTNLGKLFS